MRTGEGVILEKNDVAALRMAEARGWFPSEGELARAELATAEYPERLRRLYAAGVIRSFKTTLVVPPLVGGDWVWAAMVASPKRALGAANSLSQRLPYVSEIVINAGLPEGLGPSLALLFYSRDFESETEFIRNSPDIGHHEVYRVTEYSFPVALPLSSDERELIRYLVERPDSDIAAAGSALGRNPAWMRAKLDRLLWSEANRSGVVRVQPEIDWSTVQNYGHFHFLLETGHKPDQLERLVAEEGFALVFAGRPYQGQYVQVEADLWGVGRLMDAVVYLNQIAGVRVAGVLWNRELVVNTRWVAGLL
jgi:hypothetical protein